MILKLKNGCYVDFERGYELGAQTLGDGSARVWCNYSRGSNVTVMDGYASVQDAQDALDEFMSEHDVATFPAPESDDVDSEDDQSEEDDDSELVSYEDMSVEELRAECAGRTPPLSTSGKKADLIARLSDDDAKNAEANVTLV